MTSVDTFFVHEITSAFRNSLDQAHKAQKQLQHLAVKAQELYLDRWLGMGVQAWHQTQANVWKGVVDGAVAPLLKAAEDFVCDLKEIVSEPVPPVVVVTSRFWNRTVQEINRHANVSIDKKQDHFHEFASKSYNFKHQKRI
mmetsp:Transcript_57004/g.121036  ORF Transcript_57004/g.121036 Transcript_57004/m.121036 type:complete len:141 (-) Transcript_57004:1354-1776(-)